MSYIEKMHAKQFADLLLSMKDNETIEFGTCYEGFEENPEVISPDDVSGWYFVRKMYVPEYSSRFLLIDYCGGEEAFAIPLNNYQEEADIEDKNLVHAEVIRYFNICRGLSGEKFVYVERKYVHEQLEFDGYGVFDFDGTGMLEICRYDDEKKFASDEEAVQQAIKDGVKIIPVNELPENFDRRYLGWIDTPENRIRIRDYCNNPTVYYANDVSKKGDLIYESV